MVRENRIVSNETVFSTPWFDVKAKCYHGSQDPYYVLKLLDYVSILAITNDGQILLVEQYRPVVEGNTLELPSGHVEEGESPEEAAHRELLEETGYKANEVKLLGTLIPDTGRLGNKMWCYFAPNVVKVNDCSTEENIKLVK
jgi:ADP-ribose pyrophosphatase